MCQPQRSFVISCLVRRGKRCKRYIELELESGFLGYRLDAQLNQMVCPNVENELKNRCKLALQDVIRRQIVLLGYLLEGGCKHLEKVFPPWLFGRLEWVTPILADGFESFECAFHLFLVLFKP